MDELRDALLALGEARTKLIKAEVKIFSREDYIPTYQETYRGGTKQELRAKVAKRREQYSSAYQELQRLNFLAPHLDDLYTPGFMKLIQEMRYPWC